ncbi:hypothetical protein CTAYLR_004239 [Chrysophaeum taylorii]|uniref:Amino acid transporter transmembrane domain-containing protein n=1 Tax=Chrysophaeum taylorii TaxID=2483200 RepID=A0AAD7XI49_9STRA|nr:hypothetical protein CTAYLR_004239 [Chrysophaeum taylorii]
MPTASPIRGSGFDTTSLETSSSENSKQGPSVERPGSLLSCSFNLANTVLGSGMLGLPLAFANVGSGLGIALLGVFGALSALGLHLLAQCAEKVPDGAATFRSVAELAAPRFASLIDVAIGLKCFGVATSYLIVVGDSMPRVIHHGIWRRREPWLVLAVLVVAPLSALEKLDGLKFTSGLSLAFVAYLTIMIIALQLSYDCDDDDNCGSSSRVADLGLRATKTLPVFVYGYTCHQNMFSVCNEIASPTRLRIDTVILVSISVAFCVYLAVGLAGFDTFGTHVEGDILTNYSASPVVATARVFVAFLVSLSYPLQCHPSRACVFSLLESRHPDIRQNTKARLVFTAAFLALSFLIASAVKSLSLVMSLVGATGSTAISYILPGGIYYYLYKDDPRQSALKCRLAFSLFAFGLCVVPTALVLIFI